MSDPKWSTELSKFKYRIGTYCISNNVLKIVNGQDVISLIFITFYYRQPDRFLSAITYKIIVKPASS